MLVRSGQPVSASAKSPMNTLRTVRRFIVCSSSCLERSYSKPGSRRLRPLFDTYEALKDVLPAAKSRTWEPAPGQSKCTRILNLYAQHTGTLTSTIELPGFRPDAIFDL